MDRTKLRSSALSALPAIRYRKVSVPAVIVMFCVVASLASPWSISIPPAHLAQGFGFLTVACWITVLALLAAALLDLRAAVIAVAIATAVLAAWFGWAMWVVKTPRFTQLPFPFVGTDIIGPGWYAAAVGLLAAAGSVIKGLQNRDAPIGSDLWIFTTIPGFGLMRLGSWGRGLVFALLFCSALYFGSTDSPDPALFSDYGQSGNVPPPMPRSPEWVLLGVAAAIWLLSIAATVWQARKDREAQIP